LPGRALSYARLLTEPTIIQAEDFTGSDRFNSQASTYFRLPEQPRLAITGSHPVT